MTHHPHHSPARRAGFTLVEVLCALVLIGVVLPVAMRGISLSLAAASKARHTGEASELARHKLAELSLQTDTSLYSSSGDFGADWPEYKWQSTFVSRDYGVNELTVTVTWKSRGEDQSLALSTLTYPGAYLMPDTTDGTTSTSGSGTGAGTGGTQ